MSAVQALWTLQLLVSTALLAKILTTYKKDSFGFSICDIWDKQENREYNYKCSQITGGVVSYVNLLCTFIKLLLYVDITIFSIVIG